MVSEPKSGCVYVSFLFVLLIAGTSFAESIGRAADADIVGVWACQSISGGAYTGRPCRLEPWLKIKEDKYYEWGRDNGEWNFANQTLTLSKRKGKGHLNSDGKLIFEYEMKGKKYVLTLYKRHQ